MEEKVLIRKALSIANNIRNLEEPERKKIFNISKPCPRDDANFVQPDFQFQLLQSKILNRKVKSEIISRKYNKIKDKIKIELLAEQSSARLGCPICTNKIKICKYLTGTDRSYWNPSNFYKHLDKFLEKSANRAGENHDQIETDETDGKGLLIFFFFPLLHSYFNDIH